MEQKPAHSLRRLYDQKSDDRRTRPRGEAVFPASMERPPFQGCIHEENTEVDDSISHHDASDSTCLEPVARSDSSAQAVVSCNEDILLDVDEPERRVASAGEDAQAIEAAEAGAAPAAARHDITAGWSDVDKGAGVSSRLRVAQLVQVTFSCVHVLLVCLAITQNPSLNPGNFIECEKLSYQISKLQDENLPAKRTVTLD